MEGKPSETTKYIIMSKDTMTEEERLQRLSPEEQKQFLDWKAKHTGTDITKSEKEIVGRSIGHITAAIEGKGIVFAFMLVHGIFQKHFHFNDYGCVLQRWGNANLSVSNNQCSLTFGFGDSEVEVTYKKLNQRSKK